MTNAPAEADPTLLAALADLDFGAFAPEAPGVARERDVLAPFRAAGAVFNGCSLTAWQHLASAAGVPMIDAGVVLDMPLEVVFRFDRPLPEDAIWHERLRQAAVDCPPGAMLRWDCCAGLDLKCAMDAGTLDRDAVTRLECGDPRFFDIAFTYPGDAIAVLQRPWQVARRVLSHPVEYRVFVENDEVLGISSYYPQRPLECDESVARELTEALGRARRLVAAAQAGGRTPWMAQYARAGMDPRKVSCTLDFLVSDTGEVLLIEAGPPFGAGAHPCCFVDNREDGRISVRGVALAQGAPVLELARFEPAARRCTP